MSDRARLLFVVALTTGCVAMAAWGVDVAGVAAALSTLRPAGFTAAALSLLAVFVLRVARYALLLGAARPPAGELFSACGVGLLAVHVLPLRLGDLVRPSLLTRAGVPFGRALGAIAVERLLDLLALVAMVGASGAVDLPGRLVVGGVDLLEVGGRAATLASLGLAVGLALLVALGGAVEPALARLPGLGPRLAGLVRSAGDAVRGLGPAPAAAAALFTAVIWCCNAGTGLALLHAWPGLPARAEVALVVTTSAVVGTLALPTPGLVGAFELSVGRSLALWSVDLESATALALVWHALTLGLHAGIGGAVLLREGRSLGSVVRASRAPLGESVP